jgi:hypothetical protein
MRALYNENYGTPMKTSVDRKKLERYPMFMDWKINII